MGIYRRWMAESVRQALETWRVVSIAGARQCGKTTLASLLPQTGMTCRSLDESIYLRSAKEDPATFLRHAPGTTLFIDEIQKAPRFFRQLSAWLTVLTNLASFCLPDLQTSMRFPKRRKVLQGGSIPHGLGHLPREK